MWKNVQYEAPHFCDKLNVTLPTIHFLSVDTAVIESYVITAYLTSIEQEINFSMPGVPSTLAHFLGKVL